MTVNSPPRKHGLSMQTGKERSLTKVRIAPACPRTLFSNFTKTTTASIPPVKQLDEFLNHEGFAQVQYQPNPTPRGTGCFLPSLSLLLMGFSRWSLYGVSFTGLAPAQQGSFSRAAEWPDRKQHADLGLLRDEYCFSNPNLDDDY